MMDLKTNSQGFTLIEIIVAIAITAIVMAGVFSTYKGQQDAHLGQAQVIEMQQNIRAGLHVMLKEIRMAGYDPHGTSGAGIVQAGDGTSGNPFTFTFVADDDGEDNDNDALVDEQGELKTISFELYDAYGDGDDDIGRKVGAGTNQPLAENIAVLNFVYLDQNGTATAVLSDIRAVGITITATTEINRTNYTGSNRTLSTTVKCRNLGL